MFSAVRCRLIAISILFCFVGPARADTKIDIDPLEKKIFGETRNEAGCKVIDRGPGLELKGIDLQLHEQASTLFELFKGYKESGYRDLFHPLIKKRGGMGERVMATLRHRYDKPWNWSVYRIWGLRSPNSDPITIPCPKDGLALKVRNGYRIQIGMWLQIMGQNELGRIYVNWAPTPYGWRIVGLHLQQWSHGGLDHEAWIQKGLKAKDSGDRVSTFMIFDLAQKLLFGGDFIEYSIKERVIYERDQAMSKDQLVQSLQTLLNQKSIVYAGTVLAADGLGLLIRETVPAAMSTHDLQKRCLAKGKALIREKFLSSDMAGLRCSFITRGADPLKDGPLGGFYYTRDDLTKKTL